MGKTDDNYYKKINTDFRMKRKIKIIRIHGTVGAYENGKLLGWTYSNTDTTVLNELNIDPLTVDIEYQEYGLPEDMDQSFPQTDLLFDFLQGYKLL